MVPFNPLLKSFRLHMETSLCKVSQTKISSFPSCFWRHLKQLLRLQFHHTTLGANPHPLVWHEWNVPVSWARWQLQAEEKVPWSFLLRLTVMAQLHLSQSCLPKHCLASFLIAQKLPTSLTIFSKNRLHAWFSQRFMIFQYLLQWPHIRHSLQESQGATNSTCRKAAFILAVASYTSTQMGSHR